MLDKRRSKKLTKSIPVDQQLITLNKEKMELKKEMFRKMDHQEQQFNQTIKILQKNYSMLLTVERKKIQKS